MPKISDYEIPLVHTFHPLNYKVRDIISRNFEILKNDTMTSAIFTDNPLRLKCELKCIISKDQFAYREGCNTTMALIRCQHNGSDGWAVMQTMFEFCHLTSAEHLILSPTN